MIRYGVLSSLLLSVLLVNSAYALEASDFADYCVQNGGVVEEMPAEFAGPSGAVQGLTKTFCQFHVDNGLIHIGLETYASTTPNIAATYIKNLPTLDPSSKLFKGKYSNPSHNVCKNLGGATIGFVANGSFADQYGQSDICVFGDGSMISAWSLIYMANHRTGYDAIKDQVRSMPLPIAMPL